MSKKESVFIACPTHDGRIHTETAVAMYASASRIRDCGICVRTSSLLNLACNELWMMAITQGNHQWFAMLHSDIGPEPYWVDNLIDIALRHDADMVSAIIPIKNNSGLTSTAIERLDGEMGFERRLTMREIWAEDFPDVYEHPRLMVNTGCCVVRMSDRICDPSKVYFDNPNKIVRTIDGGWQVQTTSEDWFFSSRVRQAGGKVVATRAIQANHHGQHKFPNNAVWGEDHDLQAITENPPLAPNVEGPPAPRIMGVRPSLPPAMKEVEAACL